MSHKLEADLCQFGTRVQFELNRESELYLVFEAEFIPDQLEFFPAIVLASWVESYRFFVSYCSII